MSIEWIRWALEKSLMVMASLKLTYLDNLIYISFCIKFTFLSGLPTVDSGIMLVWKINRFQKINTVNSTALKVSFLNLILC